MPYSERAKELRRCSEVKADGSPCRAWALWDDPRRLCVTHAGRGRRGKYKTGASKSQRTHFIPCACIAYAWPHRPGGGLCRWPDPPTQRLTTPAGTHEQPRISPEWRGFVRKMRRRRKSYAFGL
jgi:hypothetical protein